MVADGALTIDPDVVPLLCERDYECGYAEQGGTSMFSVSSPAGSSQRGFRRSCRPARVCIFPLCTVLGTLLSLCVWENMLRREGQGMLLVVADVVKAAPVKRGCAPDVIQGLSRREQEAAQGLLHEIVVSRQQREHLDLQSRECCLLGTVFHGVLNRSGDSLLEFLGGAHVVVTTAGSSHTDTLYMIMMHMQGAYQRRSSHSSSAPQYGVPQGRLLRTLLVGRQVQDPQRTWFQVEGANWAPLKNPFESTTHILNWLRYIVTGLQVGPLGSSIYTDRRPLEVTVVFKGS